MTVLELENSDCNGQRVVRFDVDGKQYLLIAPQHGRWITIIYGQWIGNKRSLGRTYHRASDLEGKYKKHGAIIADYVKQIAPNMEK